MYRLHAEDYARYCNSHWSYHSWWHYICGTFGNIPVLWLFISLLSRIFNRPDSCYTVTFIGHYVHMLSRISYVQFIAVKIHCTFVIHTWSYVTIRPRNTYKGAIWLSWLLILTWFWHAWIVYIFVLYW